MISQMHPEERQQLEDAQGSVTQSCAHCRFMTIQTGPASSPYAPEVPGAAASLFCRFSPPMPIFTSKGILGIYAPVRPDGWCGHFEEQTTRSISGYGK